MSNLIQRWQSQIGLGRESAWGTAAAETEAVPFETLTAEDKTIELVDNGYRGDATKDQGYYPGATHSEISIESNAYPTTIGNWFAGLLGKDTMTGAGPYTHAINTATGAPPSYSFTDFLAAAAGGQARQYAGVYLSDLALKYVSATEMLKCSIKGMGKASTLVAKPTGVYPADAPLLGWQGALSLGGSANIRLTEAALDIKRPVEMVKGSGGTQDPDFGSVGQVEATGTLSFAVVDEAEYLTYRNNTQPTFSLLFTSGANLLTISMAKEAFTAGLVERTKDYALFRATVRGIKNTTDAGALSALLVNTRNVAYSA